MAQQKQKIAIQVSAAVLLAAALALVLVKYLHHIHLQRVEGAWEGLLEHHAGPLMRKQRMVLKIFRENGSYYAAIDQVDNGLKNFPVTSLSIGRSSVKFEVSNGFTYNGKLNGEEITGRWKWPDGNDNYSQPLRFVRTTTPDKVPEPLAEAEYAPRPDMDLQGFWKGALKVGTNSYRLHLKIAQPTAGNFRAELDSIDQPPVIPLPITAMEYHGSTVKFSMQGIGGAFDGQLSGSQITGSWTQGGKWPLTFERANPKEDSPDAGKNYDYKSEAELPGHWTGTLPGRYGLHLRVVFNIAQLPDESFSGTLDSPDQLLFAMPFNVMTFTTPNVHLENKTANCVFDGKLLEGKLSGTWVFNKKLVDALTLERERPIALTQ
jgi:hypothetical protein